MVPGDRVYVRLPSDDKWTSHVPATLVALANQEASVRLQDHTLITVKRNHVLAEWEFREHLLAFVRESSEPSSLLIGDVHSDTFAALKAELPEEAR